MLRIFRTKLFGYIQSASQIMQLLGPVLAAVTMEKSVYIPLWIGIAAFVTAFPTTALLPDTRHMAKRSTLTNTPYEALSSAEQDPLLASQVESNGEGVTENNHNHRASSGGSTRVFLRGTFQKA